jgi:hypothetical protein
MEKKYTFEGKIVKVDLYGKIYQVKLVKEKYHEGNIAIQGVIVGGIEDGELFATLSVNMPAIKGLLGEDEIFIKSYSENESFADAVRNSGYFTDTTKRTPSGFVLLEIWKMIKCPEKAKPVKIKKTKLYTVRFMTVYQEWTGIKATNQKDAINQCQAPLEFDSNEPCHFIAVEED